jgi:hypothetical protein
MKNPMKAQHVKRTIRFKYQNHNVTMHITAFRQIDDDFAASCIADFKRATKKLKHDVEVTFPTLLGASDPL